MELTCAVQYAAQGDLDGFTRIVDQNREKFLGDPRDAHSALTILLNFCPESLVQIADLVYDLWGEGDLNRYYADTTTPSSLAAPLPEHEVSRRHDLLLEYIRQNSLKMGWDTTASNTTALSDWIRIRVKQVDACFGVIDNSLVRHKDVPQDAAEWFDGVAQVALTFRHSGHHISIDTLEKDDDGTNVSKLLSHSRSVSIGRDFDQLVVPYVAFKDNWDGVFKWIGQCENLGLLVPLAKHSRLQRAIIAACYLCHDTTDSTWKRMDQISVAVAASDDDSSSKQNPHVEISDFDSFETLMKSELSASVGVFSRMIQSAALISSIYPISLADTTKVCFCGDQTKQTALLQHYAAATRRDNWTEIYQNVMHLKDQGVFAKVDNSTITHLFISHALKQGSFEFIQQEFDKTQLDQRMVLEAFDMFYDQATNGSQTRGSMKQAANCLKLAAVDGSDPEVEARQSLLNATHQLSTTFSLTLRPGVPLKPVELKAYCHDPLYVINRVLELNDTAYKRCSELTSIAFALVTGLGHGGYSAPDTVDVRVRAMCAEYALVNGDFEAAFAYCMPALSTLAQSTVAWPACFQVGKYVSPAWGGDHSGHGSRKVLNKQLAILSATLQICPRESIGSVLRVWQQKDDLLAEFDSQRADPSSAAAALPLSLSSPSASTDSLPMHGDDAHRGERKRDQISNLLVSGLGWAIGANQS